MPEFKNKEEYEKWKAERIKQTREASEAKNLQQAKAEIEKSKDPAFTEIKAEDRGSVSLEEKKSKKNIKLYIALAIVSVSILVSGIFFYNSYFKLATKKFDGVYHAAKKIEAATSVGVNYMQFGELLQNLATEILILKDKKKTKKEEELFDIYEGVLFYYKSSYEEWKKKIDYPYSYGEKADDLIQTRWQLAKEELMKADILLKDK